MKITDGCRSKKSTAVSQYNVPWCTQKQDTVYFLHDQPDCLFGATCCIMCSYLQQCSGGNTDGQMEHVWQLKALRRCITYEMSHGGAVRKLREELCGDSKHETCSPFVSHLPCTAQASHAWRLLLATTHACREHEIRSAAGRYITQRHTVSLPCTHKLSLSTHVNSTCAQYTHCFNQLFHWSHSDSFIHYATSHKPMISEKALTIISFQSSVWTGLFVFLHVAIESKNRAIIKLQIVFFFSPGSVVQIQIQIQTTLCIQNGKFSCSISRRQT